MKNLTYCLILFFTTDLLWSQQATLHPTTFTSQGVLRDAQGRSLEDDTYQMTFEIYPNSTGTGNPLWSETADVLVTNGVWTYTFGSSSSNPLDNLDEDANYMKITVNGDALSPLTRISLSAMETLNVSDGGNLITASGDVGIGTTSPSAKFEVVGSINLDGRIRVFPGTSGSNLADTFTGNTSKSKILFEKASGSTDPGAIMHETTGSGAETNEGVLHLMPSDDNAYGDYVSIHGTTQPDVLKLHTDGTIEGAKEINSEDIRTERVYNNMTDNNVNPEIRFKSHTHGDAMYLGGGGKTVVASGEFSGSYYGEDDTHSTEELILGSDGAIKFYTNAQTYADKKHAMTIESNADVIVNENLYTNYSHIGEDSRNHRVPQADYDSGWFDMQSNSQTLSREDKLHDFGFYPAQVKVLVKGTQGTYDGWIFDAGSLSTSDDDGGNYGGVIYAYNETTVRVFLPKKNNNQQGYAIFLSDGWAEGENYTSHNVKVRVLCWK